MADVLAVDDVTHLIVTRDEHGFFAESPQVPGLVLGRPTETEFREAYRGVLKDVGVRGHVVVHLQTRGTTADGREFIIRCADDGAEARRSRYETAGRIERCLSSEQDGDMLDTQTTATGEVVFAAALPTDTLGFFMDQLYDQDDALVISASVADNALFTMTFASGRRDGESWETLEQYGWTRDTIVSELLVDWSRSPQKHRVLV